MLVKQPERKPIPEELMVKLVERYESGEGMQKLAEDAGCSRQTLTEKMRRRGVTIRGRGRPKGSTKAKKEEAPAAVPLSDLLEPTEAKPGEFDSVLEEKSLETPAEEEKPKVLGRRIIDL